ncbi:hypothetical protein C0J52_06822 [Blattella germanica]|nr:hypothetical protein C0J52_06822 [Blattella germanica]
MSRLPDITIPDFFLYGDFSNPESTSRSRTQYHNLKLFVEKSTTFQEKCYKMQCEVLRNVFNIVLRVRTPALRCYFQKMNFLWTCFKLHILWIMLVLRNKRFVPKSLSYHYLKSMRFL